ncbi:MAG: Na/Pi symporter [Corynebacterium sp.]|nr:Na/Pi symporter [Corynebacterium sp.]
MTKPRPGGGTQTADVAEDAAADLNTAGLTAGEQQEAQEQYPLSFLNLTGTTKTVVDWVVVAVAIWVLITAVSAIGSGFGMAAGDQAEELFQFAENPFVGLMIGVLATVLTQSSSTTTSITVGMVAGGLPIEVAIPILFGANIGTTVTSTLVSLGMANDKVMFRRGFAAASVHDMYNLISVLIFFPLELIFAPLQRSSEWLSDQLAGEDAGPVGALFDGLGAAVSFLTDPGVDALEWAVSPLGAVGGGITLILLGVILILAVISFIGKMLKALLVGTAQKVFHNAIGRGPVSGVASGTLVTVLVQSSSTTTSLAVPLAATGKFSLQQIFPFVVGANIGTTITALIAAFGFSGIEGQAALQAAFVHLLYNVFAALLIMSLPGLRTLPRKGAELLARLGAENKLYVAVWVVGIFLAIPALLILVTTVI